MRLHSKLFLILISFCFISALVFNFLGNAQNEKISEENLKIKMAMESSDKDPNLSISLLSDIKKDRPEGYQLYLLLSEAYLYAGDYKNSTYYAKKALNKRPAIILDTSFCLQYAGLAYQFKDIDLMKAYILQAQINKSTPEEIQFVNEMIRSVNELEKE